MGSHVPKPARFRCKIVRTGAGRARTGALDDSEHRKSGTACRLSCAKSKRGHSAKAGAARRVERRKARTSNPETDIRAVGDRRDPAKTAKRCSLAVLRCAATRLSAFANQGDPARAG